VTPALLVLGVCMAAAAALFFAYLRAMRDDAVRERLRAGVEEDEPEQVSLWKDTADLLQLTRLRQLVETSPLTRTLELRLKQLSAPWALPKVVLATTIPIGLMAGVTHVALGRPEFSVLTALTVPLLLWWLLKALATHRVHRIEQQLPGLVSQMITALRSGGTPANALRVAAHNTRPPLGPSIAAVIDAVAIGVAPARAWRDWSALWRSRACDLLATAIRLKWEAGGELSTLLEVILDQLEARRQRELRIRTLTAMAKLSTHVLIALPIALAAYTWSINPRLFNEMVSDPIGVRALWITAGLLVVGYVWMRKIAKLED
jgi:tight adherence protein B